MGYEDISSLGSSLSSAYSGSTGSYGSQYSNQDSSKITKVFSCKCGNVNRFEFDTNFDVGKMIIVGKCTNCGREIKIRIENMLTFEESGERNVEDVGSVETREIKSEEKGEDSKMREGREGEEDMLSNEVEEYSGEVSDDEVEEFSNLFGKL